MSRFARGFFVLAMGSLLGKAVALVREVVFAGAFGTGSVASGFRVAQTATIVPANLVSGDLLSAAFAPTYARDAKLDPARAKSMLQGYILWISVVLLGVSMAVYFSRTILVGIIVPGADAETLEQATILLGLLCWVIPLYGLSAVQAYALGAHGNYLPTSSRQMLQSVGLLLGTLLAVTTGWMPWLAVGLLAAWVVNVCICWGLLVRGHLVGIPRKEDFSQGGRFVIEGAKGIAPLFMLPVALQLSIVLERVFASLGDPGLVAAVDYARTISESVMSVVAVPLGILGLTQLSALGRRDYRRQVSRMNDTILVLIFPISAVLVVCARPIVELLYKRGEFGPEAELLTTNVLVGLSAGLAFQVLGYSLSRALTAVGRNRAVLVCTLAAIFGQIVVQWQGITTLGPVAIGLGPSTYGIILTLGTAFALGLERRLAWQLFSILPAMAATVVLVLYDLDAVLELVLVTVVWVANIGFVKSLRLSVTDIAASVFRRNARE